MTKDKTIAVIGAGIYGLYTANRLISKGYRVIVLDKSPNSAALQEVCASAGKTRIFRRLTIEGKSYIERAKLAEEEWHRLQDFLGVEILHSAPFLIAAETGSHNYRHHGVNRLIARARNVAVYGGISHSALSTAAIREFAPWIRTETEVQGILDRGAFILQSDLISGALLRRVIDSPKAELRLDCKIRQISKVASRLSLSTDRGDVLQSDHVVICTGPWLDGINCAELGLTVAAAAFPQVYVEGNVERLTKSSKLNPKSFAFAFNDGRLLYGMTGGVNERYCKLGIEQEYVSVSDPEKIDKRERESFIESQLSEIRRSVSEVGPIDPYRLKQFLCHYSISNSKDHHVLTSSGGRVHRILACNGHGYKYASYYSQIISDRIG